MFQAFGFPDTPEGDAAEAKLSEKDKQFRSSLLPYLLMDAGIGVITHASIPHIVARTELTSLIEALGQYIPDNCNGPKEYLKRFIGHKTNVYTESKPEWIRRMGRNIPDLSKRKALQMVRECDAMRYQ